MTNRIQTTTFNAFINHSMLECSMHGIVHHCQNSEAIELGLADLTSYRNSTVRTIEIVIVLNSVDRTEGGTFMEKGGITKIFYKSV